MESWLAWRLDEIPPEQMSSVLAVVAVAGLLYCFLGYRLFKVVLGLTGFLLAGAVALVPAGWFSQGNLTVMAVAVLLGGLCGAMAFFFIYRAGVFSLGLLGALLIAYKVLHGRPEPWAPWAIFGIALAGGLLALLIERPLMTLATAAIGAWLTTFAGATFVLGLRPGQPLTESSNEGKMPLVLLGVWVGLTLLGALVQLAGVRRDRKAG